MDLLDSEPLPLKYLQPSSTEDEEEKAHSDNGCMSDETADHSQEYHKYVSPRRHSLGRDRDTKKRDDYKVKARYAALRGRAGIESNRTEILIMFTTIECLVCTLT